MEPGHEPGCRAGRRRVRVLGQPHRRLQPHAPQRHRLPVLPGRPHPPHSRCRRQHARGLHRIVHARPGAGPSRSLPARAGSGADRRLARRHHAQWNLELRLPSEHRVQHPVQGRGQRQSRHGGRRADRRARRSGGPGHQRPVLRDGNELHPALRGAVRPSLLLGRHLERVGHQRRELVVHGCLLRRLRDLRHHDAAHGADEGRDLVRERAGRGTEPSGGGPGVVGVAGGRAGRGTLERAPRTYRRPRRHAEPAAHVLHRALPLAPLPQRRVGRQRRLPRQRREDALRPWKAGVRQLLRVGHLSKRDTARVASRAPRRRRHGAVARGQRRAGRLAAQVADRRRRRVADQRGLRRSHHRRRLRHGRAQFRRAGRAPLHGEGGNAERDGPWPRDRAPIPEPVPEPALRQRRLARPDVHRLFHRRLGDAGIRARRLRHRPDRHGRARSRRCRRHGAARRHLGVRVQSRHRLHPGQGRRRQLSSRPGLRGVAARAGWTDRLRGGQRGAVHVERPAGPRRARRR